MDSGSRSQHSLGRNDGTAVDPAAAQRAAAAVPSIPRDAEGPVFREPWEAQAFAMALALNERGLFTWIVAEKGATDARTLARYRAAWDHAADRTPHGTPIELQPEDFE